MRTAYPLACQALPKYSSKFSRRDFTLPQLYACLTVKEMQRRSYRSAEALLRDSDSWLRDVGLTRAPDHNTLHRAARFLLSRCRVVRLLDAMARWAATLRILQLSTKPLVIDSSHYEFRHVSRHYERRRDERGRSDRSGRSDTNRRLPKMALASTCSHPRLSLWTGTGTGADHPYFEPVLYDAWRRMPDRRIKAAADGGYDSQANHKRARGDLGVVTLNPPLIGRPSKGGRLPSGRWRRHMKRLLATSRSRRRCGYTQRWQAETTHSMIKRNLGSELSGKTADSRERDLRLKALTQNVMVL